MLELNCRAGTGGEMGKSLETMDSSRGRRGVRIIVRKRGVSREEYKQSAKSWRLYPPTLQANMRVHIYIYISPRGFTQCRWSRFHLGSENCLLVELRSGARDRAIAYTYCVVVKSSSPGQVKYQAKSILSARLHRSLLDEAHVVHDIGNRDPLACERTGHRL